MSSYAELSAIRFIDSWLGYQAVRADIPGFSVAIYSGDNMLFSRAYGYADMASEIPLTPDHIFAMASQSKLFTATAILQLAEREKLRIDDMAVTHLPWLAPHSDHRMRTVTIRQLLTHRSGIARETLEADYWQRPLLFPTADELRRAVLSRLLTSSPGKEIKYSNVGFGLLGQIIEAAGGRPYVRYVTDNIIAPLGYRDDLTPDYPAASAGRMTKGYGPSFAGHRPEIEHRQSAGAFAPAAGIHGTAEAMCYFASKHFLGDTTLLSDASKKAMQRKHASIATGYDEGSEFGLGCEVLHIGKRRFVGHGAHVHGHLTATFFEPRGQLAVTVLGNCHDAPSVQMLQGIVGALDFFAANSQCPPSADIAKFNTRIFTPVSSLEVVATAKRIVTVDPDSWEPFGECSELIQTSPSTLKNITPGSLFGKDEELRYTFDKRKVAAVRYAGLQMLPK